MTPAERLDHHLFDPGPKRILSLEGGGVRGVISLAFLERIEGLVKSRARDGAAGSDFRLCHYFSLIGGTSTGAIIAAGLALGHSVSELIDLYLHISRESFVPRRWLGVRWFGGNFLPRFKDEALREAILSKFGPDTLGSPRVACGLAIVAKRLDSGSVWLFHNHPRGAFFGGSPGEPAAPSAHVPNRDLKIADLLRASTAAPSYFGPQLLDIAPGAQGLFVDGGIGPHNNPSLLLLMLATLQGYGFRWPMGEENLLLVSLGTGDSKPAPLWGKTYLGKPAGMFAVEALYSAIYDSSRLAEALLQWMSSSPTAIAINSELGNLSGDLLGGQNLLRYLRYDAPVDAGSLGRMGIRVSPQEAARLKPMDRPGNTARLLDIGREAAEILVKPEHFPAFFDV